MSEPLFAFLRAVNLGKFNQVPMADLVKATATEGLPPTRYLLASGNLVLDGATPEEGLRTAIVDLIAKRYDVATAVVFRTPRELQELLKADPFTPAGLPTVHASLWDETPDPAGLKALAGEEFGNDALHLLPDAAVMGYHSNSHTSKLTNALIERRLKVPATARNLNTFRRLLERFAP
ncbi:MAG: DUF1697 domain-containing protein [Trueperaceae bacterium]|nr:DUF1697 domain-containing protein [Trueperaceae bacterium]